MKDLRAIRFIPNTKVSHDYDGDHVETFSYRDLWSKGIPAIGIPAKQNRLVVIDVDVVSEQHKHDGREWWQNFCSTHEIPMDYTYTVRTASGGFHFYFSIPEAVNLATFSPPSKLADGVDVKYNGWVAAPPTSGYTPINKTLLDIMELPIAILMEFDNIKTTGKTSYFEDHIDPHNLALSVHTPFTKKQIENLKIQIDWIQVNAELDRNEWRDGLFSLKAGMEDENLLEELATKWTMNKSYRQGDEAEAISIVKRADKFGPVGPATIFSIIQKIRIRQGAPIATCDFERGEVFDRAKVPVHMDNNGNMKIVPTESNIASIIGAAFPIEVLYHDIRMDLFKFKGEVYSDADLVNTLCPIIQSESEGLGLQNVRKAAIAGGLDVLMAQRKIDPHLEYLNDLEWDGVSRIDNFFYVYVECRG